MVLKLGQPEAWRDEGQARILRLRGGACADPEGRSGSDTKPSPRKGDERELSSWTGDDSTRTERLSVVQRYQVKCEVCAKQTTTRLTSMQCVGCLLLWQAKKREDEEARHQQQLLL